MAWGLGCGQAGEVISAGLPSIGAPRPNIAADMIF